MWLVLAAVTWGVLAFGAVYPWAYVPLLIAAAGIGILGMGRPVGAGLEACASGVRWPVAASLAAVGLAIALQECVEFSLQIPSNAVLFVVLAAIALHTPTPRA